MASGRTQFPEGITGIEIHRENLGVKGGAAPSSTSGQSAYLGAGWGRETVYTGGQWGSALWTPWANGDMTTMAGPQHRPFQADRLRPVLSDAGLGEACSGMLGWGLAEKPACRTLRGASPCMGYFPWGSGLHPGGQGQGDLSSPCEQTRMKGTEDPDQMQ